MSKQIEQYADENIEAFKNKAFLENPLIHELFEQVVEKSPEAIALEFEKQTLTYGQLNQYANELAHRLIDMGVKPDDRVALCVDRSLEMVIAIMAILKAGGAYVPMDPASPEDRRAHMLSDSAPVVFLTGTAQANLAPENIPVLVLENEIEPPYNYGNPEIPDLNHSNLSYVIYTSGSTGTPKGVMIEHRNVVSQISGLDHAYQLKASDRFLQFATPSFDASIEEIFGALLSGAALILRTNAWLTDGESWFDLCDSHGITLASLPTMFWHQLAQNTSAPIPAHLRLLIIGGDAVSPSALDLWWSRSGHKPLLLNTYGPTETTVNASIETCSPDGNPKSIGKPVSNTHFYILDEFKQTVPPGVSGEIYIGGKNVARGYLNRPDLTDERFLSNPFSDTISPDDRIYKSGDLGRWLPDGSVEFLGRNDFQVKIRGFRIELGEIESLLSKQEGVGESVVIAREDTSSSKNLVAYLVAENSIDLKTLRKNLSTTLPGYMVPAAYVVLDSLPLTLNGKLDRNALPVPAEDAFAREEFLAPAGAIEETLASIWSDLLNIQWERIGRLDNFFALGGHSLLVIHMISKIKGALGVNLNVRAVYANPSIKELGSFLQNKDSAVEYINLKEEAVLDPDIKAGGDLRSPGPGGAGIILLTGATGFVGGYLLEELLKQTESKIYCLVRAQSLENARKRLNQISFLQNYNYFERVFPVLGDMSKANMGMQPKVYADLCDKVDTVYHNATYMDHLATYKEMKMANVDGTRDILRFCCERKLKRLQYVSTIDVFSQEKNKNDSIRDENSPIENEFHSQASGYAGSKWVAEKLVMTAQERGIPANIFRLGLVTGDRTTGNYDKNQWFYQLMELYLELGAAFDINKAYQVPLIPVDFVAESLVRLSQENTSHGNIFHLTNPESHALEDIVDLYNEVNERPLAKVTWNAWKDKIKASGLDGSMPILALIQDILAMDESAFANLLEEHKDSSFQVSSHVTEFELTKAGLSWPVMDRKIIRRYFSFVQQAELNGAATGASVA